MRTELFSVRVKVFITYILLQNSVCCSPSDPKLTYVGIDAPSAITLIDQAQNSEQKSDVLNKLEKERQQGFDWNYFWKAMRSPTRLNKFVKSEKSRIFELSAESCSFSEFENFAEVVLTANFGFDFVFGPSRRCAQPLSTDLFTRYVGHFRLKKDNSSARTEAVLLAQLMNSEFLLSKETDKAKILQTLSINEWSQLIEGLLQGGDGLPAAQLVQMQQEQFGGVPYVNTLIVKWLQSPEQMKTLVEQNNVVDLAHILTTDPQLLHIAQSITKDQWTQVMAMLEKKLAVEAQRLPEQPAQLDALLRSLDLLMQLPGRAQQTPAFAVQLMWVERLMRDLEAGLKKSKEAQSLLANSNCDVTALWLTLRLYKSFTIDQSERLQQMVGNSLLNESLIRKMRMHATVSDDEVRPLFHDYCTWLESNGIQTRHKNGKDLNWQDLQLPGCLQLTGISDPTDTASLEAAGDASMGFDTVVATAGWNLNIKAESFDGSFIDLSTSLTHPDLPVEPTPTEDHAISFPLVMGIRIHDPTFNQGIGTYYFVYHFTWRTAVDGRPGKAQPAPGFSGGNLQIAVTSSESSFAPRHLSFGGPGQKGVPRRLGGKSSTSEIKWEPFENEARHTPVIEFVEHPIPFPSPTIRLLDQLFQLGEKDVDGNIKIFLDPKLLWVGLNSAQEKKALMACPNGPSDMDCWKSIGSRAGIELWNQYIEVCPKDARGTHVCIKNKLDDNFKRLSSVNYIEDQGALGPVNPDGATGAQGSYNLKEAP